MPPSALGRLVLCPDVRPDRGLGHLQRSLALGEAWQRAGGEAMLLRSDSAVDRVRTGPEIHGRNQDPGDRVPTRAESAGIALVESVPPNTAWIVLDGYEVTAEDQAWARAHADRVALIDDHAAMAAHDADLIVDQNLGASADPYGLTGTRILTGPRHALLRSSFWHSFRAPGRPEQVPEAAGGGLDLLITLGGAPSEAAVQFVHETLALLDLPAKSVATVGPLGEPVTKRGETVRSLGSPTDLAETMRRTRVALSAAGSTTWELCATGTPSVLVSVADNQLPVGQALAEAGAADHLGPVEQADPQQAADAIDRLLSGDDHWTGRRAAAREVADGRGADRVVTTMRALDIPLRPAPKADAERLWQWANDPQVRESAFDPTPIAWATHVDWLESRITNPSTSIYITDLAFERTVERSGETPERHGGPTTTDLASERTDGAAGGTPDRQGSTLDGAWAQVRFDAVADDPGTAEVDVSVAAERRGRGLAGPLLDAAVIRVFTDRPELQRIVARVKAGNPASLSAFDKAGFAVVDSTDDVVTLHRERADG